MSVRAEKSRAANDVQNTPHLLLTTAQSDLSQLVTTRRTHQTKRAANSVKTHASPQDSISPQPAERTDRQSLCSQMAELIHRAGTGLERGARWKSGTAPGTRTAMEVQGLTGNSANAELVAKERVNTVRHYPGPPSSRTSSHTIVLYRPKQHVRSISTRVE